MALPLVFWMHVNILPSDQDYACSITALHSPERLPVGQSSKLRPSSVLIHHLDQAAKPQQRLKQNQLCFSPRPAHNTDAVNF